LGEVAGMERAHRNVAGLCVANGDVARLQRHATQQRAHQCALATAVRSDDGGDLSRCGHHRYLIERALRTTSVAYTHVMKSERGSRQVRI
jgi:hypothetical protein